MELISRKEGDVLLLLFQDFTRSYNANMISKKIDITRQGALKIVKILERKQLLVSKQYGKAVFYKIRLEEEYTQIVMKYLLMSQATIKAERWIREFKEWNEAIDSIILFGSTVRDYAKANDIDVVLVVNKVAPERREIMIREKNRVLRKPLHPLWQSQEDLKKNILLLDPVLIQALKTGYILYGQEHIIRAVLEAQRKYGFSMPEIIARDTNVL